MQFMWKLEKSSEYEMNKILKFLLTLPLVVTFAHTNAQTTTVLVYGKHVVNPTTNKKVAEYKFEIDNLSKEAIQQFDLGCTKVKGAGYDTQFSFEQQNVNGKVQFGWAQTITPILPMGWQFQIQKVEGAYDYCLELRTITDNSPYGILAGKSTKNTGQNFILRLMKLDPNYVNAFIEYRYDAPIIRARPFDTTPPRLSFHLETHQHGKHHHIKHRLGWTEVEIDDIRITDNYDPHPVVLLTSVTSKDKEFKPEDVDAVYNEETKSFWVKRVPNRQYTVTYTGMDASGNKIVVSRDIWAH